jgi:galactose mutarotase-like enzyme
MRFQHQEVIQIRTDKSSALFAPQHGGRLLRWTLDDQLIIYWPDVADWTVPTKIRGGNPLLFPFIGRHVVDEQTGQWVDKAVVKRAMPAHGFAPGLPYACTVDADGAGLRMTLQHSDVTQAAYPYAFRFEAAYRFVDSTMQVTLSTSNVGNTRMPYYAGHHFYFALPHALRESTTLHLPPSLRQSLGADGVLAAPIKGETTYRLSDPRLQDRFHVLDRAGDIRMVAPQSGMEITLVLDSPDTIRWYAVGTWAERPDADYFCVEPWLGAPNAIHHQRGLRWLAPGQREDAVCTVAVRFT